MKYPFSEIIIIYNPNSTGSSKSDAEQLKAELTGELRVKITLLATSHAGHAEEIGAEYAKKKQAVLLVSASGDGGYNELVNGVLKHGPNRVTVAVLPSGNANDHHEATKTGQTLAERIVAGNTTMIDVISVNATKNGQPWQRYAHSYAGIGVTAYIGEKLTKATLNPINEKLLILKYLIRFGHVTAKVDNEPNSHRYSSIVVGNINKMSKIIGLDPDSRVDDGKLELYATPAKSMFGLLLVLVRARLINLSPNKTSRTVTVQPKRPLKLQCDGEVSTVSGTVRFSLEPAKLTVVA